MTDSEINRTIAEDRGWRVIDSDSKGQPLWWRSPDGGEHVSTSNYLDEKNPGPTHELIEVLGDDGLWVVCRRVPGGRWEVKVHDETLKVYVEVTATSFCRAVCEAYLKVIGKWTD